MTAEVLFFVAVESEGKEFWNWRFRIQSYYIHITKVTQYYFSFLAFRDSHRAKPSK